MSQCCNRLNEATVRGSIFEGVGVIKIAGGEVISGNHRMITWWPDSCATQSIPHKNAYGFVVFYFPVVIFPDWVHVVHLSTVFRVALLPVVTSSNGNIFRVTGHLYGKFTGSRWIPRTKASDAELWCFFYLRLNNRLSLVNREAGDLRRHHAHYDVIVMALGQSGVSEVTLNDV